MRRVDAAGVLSAAAAFSSSGAGVKGAEGRFAAAVLSAAAVGFCPIFGSDPFFESPLADAEEAFLFAGGAFLPPVEDFLEGAVDKTILLIRSVGGREKTEIRRENTVQMKTNNEKMRPVPLRSRR